MQQVNIHLKSADIQYPILIGEHLFRKDWSHFIPESQCCWVSQENVWRHYGPTLQNLLPQREHHCILLPDGEQHKNMISLQKILDAMLEVKLGRDAILLALGGGVVGDITGFAASIYQRGIPFIQIPTTLLAQVDASVGGKTGINHALGKNLIGSFYQPRAVLIDTQTLQTLPARELAAGWAEIIKYALIQDEALFQDLEQGTSTLEDIIARCCQHKAEIVMADEREQGCRALLNLGHTFAHAFEKIGEYQYFNHGEAVAVGLLAALYLSRKLAYAIEEQHIIRTEKLLQQYHLPTTFPASWSLEALYEAMQSDKKKQNGRLRFIVLKRFCQAMMVDDVPPRAVFETLEALRARNTA